MSVKKSKSIGRKLKETKTYQSQERALTSWVENWKNDQYNVISQLRAAAMRDDHGEIMHMIDQLNGMTEKRFTALYNVSRIVSDPERQLMDRPDDIQECVSENKTDCTPIEKLKTMQNEEKQESLVEKIVRAYKAGKDVKDIAIMHEVSYNKAIKILVTAGVYHNDIYDKIIAMKEAGKTNDEICCHLKIKKGVLEKYTPYKKGIYLSENPTKNAIRIRKCRNKSSE